MTRTFEDKPAVRTRVPLLIGLTGPSNSGKTYSAMRLAVGIERVVGGPIYFVDTESDRALHYADYFKFQHVPFPPPYGPLDYIEALEHCAKKGAKVIVVDQMSFEHNGEGGVMDQSEKWLDKRCGDNQKDRERMMMLSLVKPKGDRKKLKRWIITHGSIVFIFLYRAYDKIKPVKGGEPLKLGWVPETTSDLPYEMTARFLLTPGCQGVPLLTPEEKAELLQIKNPRQFESLLKPGQQLTEDLGERMARWAMGGSVDGAAAAGGSAAAPAASPGHGSAPKPAAAPAPRAPAGPRLAKPEDQAAWGTYWPKKGVPIERVLKHFDRASVSEFTEGDTLEMKRMDQKLRAKSAVVDDLFSPTEVEDRGDEPGPDEMPPEPGSNG